MLKKKESGPYWPRLVAGDKKVICLPQQEYSTSIRPSLHLSLPPPRPPVYAGALCEDGFQPVA